MIVLLAAVACAIAIESHPEGLLRLRPECPAAFTPTQQAVGAALARTGERRSLTLHFGRIAEYPWLSSLLARQASSSRQWDSAQADATAYVARALRGMPEFTALFGPPWRIESVAVEKVLLKPAGELELARGHPVPPERLLPYDAILSVKLAR
jgi:hypothetical protein